MIAAIARRWIEQAQSPRALFARKCSEMAIEHGQWSIAFKLSASKGWAVLYSRLSLHLFSLFGITLQICSWSIQLLGSALADIVVPAFAGMPQYGIATSPTIAGRRTASRDGSLYEGGDRHLHARAPSMVGSDAGDAGSNVGDWVADSIFSQEQQGQLSALQVGACALAMLPALLNAKISSSTAAV